MAYAHSWIASYLAGHYYQVTLRGPVSASRALITGVHVGSVLGAHPLFTKFFFLFRPSLFTSSPFSFHQVSQQSYPHTVSLVIAMRMTLNYSSASLPSDTQVATCISACLADISAWMSDHHLKLNKTELLYLLGKACPLHDLSISVDNSTVSPSQSAKNLGVTLDNTLSFSANIKAVTHSCRLMLFNIHRVQPFLT
jgi:hypothetical protein